MDNLKDYNHSSNRNLYFLGVVIISFVMTAIVYGIIEVLTN